MKSIVSLSTLEPSKAIILIGLQIEKAESLRALPSNDPERIQWCSTSRGLLIDGFNFLHEIVQDFDRNKQSIVSPHESPKQRQERKNKQLDRYISIMKSAIEQLSWRLPNDAQHFMPVGSQHDSYQQIRNIVQSTTSQILIVDNYVDETTWKLLTNVISAAKICILTMKMKNDFALEGKHFVSQHGNTVEVRNAKDIHDRFLLIDSRTVWHLGSSIKDAGTKIAFMSEIQSPMLVAVVVREIMHIWDTATPVPL